MKLAQQGLDVKQLFTREVIPQLRERSREEAIERLKRSLALREIATRESLITSEEEISTRIAALKKDYPEENIDSAKLREVVENEIFTDKIMSWMMSHSSVELVPEGSLKAVEEKKAQ